MVIGVSDPLAKADAYPPPYKPYIAPDYTAHPWLPSMARRANSLNKWQTMVTRVQGKHDISFQMRIHRHARFVIASNLCRDWGPFGGLAAQFPHIAIRL